MIMFQKIIKGLIFFFSFVLIATFFAGITIFILEGRKEMVAVPDLQRKDIISARGILEKSMLKIEEAVSYDKIIPKDYIVSQTPPAYKKIRAGNKVKVIISLGMPDVDIPRIIGRDLYSAKIILSEKGLALGNITYINSTKPKDTVLGFNPENEGTKEGDKVNLLVSAGNRLESFLMPELLGLSFGVASSTLKEHNLILGDVLLEPGTEGIVLKQKPISGTRINEGTKVNITLGIEE